MSIYVASLHQIVTNGVGSETLAEALIAMLNVLPMPRAFLVIFPGGNHKKNNKEKKPKNQSQHLEELTILTPLSHHSVSPAWIEWSSIIGSSIESSPENSQGTPGHEIEIGQTFSE